MATSIQAKGPNGSPVDLLATASGHLIVVPTSDSLSQVNPSAVSANTDIGLRNLAGANANSVWPTGLSEWAIGTKYKANAAIGLMASGDIYLQIVQHSRYAPDSGQPSKYWTASGATSWVKIFDGVTNTVTYAENSAPADLTKCSIIESGLLLTQSWSRIRDVVSLNSGGEEVVTTRTEFRKIQSSHVYPYPSIDDTGWK